jgi:hypothetical protein
VDQGREVGLVTKGWQPQAAPRGRKEHDCQDPEHEVAGVDGYLRGSYSSAALAFEAGCGNADEGC